MPRKTKQQTELALQSVQSTPQPKQKTLPYIQPLVRAAGEKHILEELSEDGETPTLKSIGYAKMGSGWVSYTVTTKGPKVISIECSDPDMRQIAEEQAKIAFVETFVDKEIM